MSFWKGSTVEATNCLTHLRLFVRQTCLQFYHLPLRPQIYSSFRLQLEKIFHSINCKAQTIVIFDIQIFGRRISLTIKPAAV